MKCIKSGFMGFIIGAVVFGSIPILANNMMEVATASLTYYFDGEQKTPPSDQQGFIVNGRTYVPLGFVAESLGKKAVWEGETQSIYISADSKYLPEVKESDNPINGQSLMFQIHEDWVYEIKGEAFNRHLYKARIDGSDKHQLTDIYTIGFYATDNWIYLIQMTPEINLTPEAPIGFQEIVKGRYQLIRMKHDGTMITKLADSEKEMTEFHIIDDTIYYYTDISKPYALLSKYSINKVGVNGSTLLAYTQPIRESIGIRDGWMYYVSTKGKICRIKLSEGAQEVQLADTELRYFSFAEIHGDWIYYQDMRNDIYRIALDGSEQKKLVENMTTRPIIHDGWIYYTDSRYNKDQPNANLYKIKVDGTDQRLVSSGVCDVLVKEDGIYFTDKWYISNLYRMDWEGNNKTFIYHLVVYPKLSKKIARLHGR